MPFERLTIIIGNVGLKEAVTLEQFTSLRSGTGYRKSSDGHIKMWGTVITSTLGAGVGGSWTVALPTAFPNAMLTASVSLGMGATGGGVFASVMDVGSPFTGTADTRLPASKATTIGGYVVNGMSAASKILLRWECEGY